REGKPVVCRVDADRLGALAVEIAPPRARAVVVDTHRIRCREDAAFAIHDTDAEQAFGHPEAVDHARERPWSEIGRRGEAGNGKRALESERLVREVGGISERVLGFDRKAERITGSDACGKHGDPSHRWARPDLE